MNKQSNNTNIVKRDQTLCVINVAVKVVNFYENGVHEMAGIFSCLLEDKVENIMEYIFIDFLKTYFEQRNVKELVEFCELLVLLDAVN